MDVCQSLDVSVLDEFTHAIWDAGTTDINKPDSYCWRDTRAISVAMDESNLRKVTHNADNYACFCLGAKMKTPNVDKTPPNVVLKMAPSRH